MFRLYLKMSLIRLKKVIKQMELGICIIHLCKTYVSCTVLQNEPWIGDGKTHVHVKNSELYFTLYNDIVLRIARNLLETRENIKIESHPFYHIICDWFSWGSSKKIFFCFIPIKISHKLCDGMDGTQFWCFPWFPPNSLLCVIYRYTVYVKKLLWNK